MICGIKFIGTSVVFIIIEPMESQVIDFLKDTSQDPIA
jgi:hypothetical protein